MNTKTTNILYWITTGLFAFFMLGSAIPNILVMQMSVDGFAQMGYPPYLVPFLGVAKLLGVIVIFIPGLPRLKEWAYAGLMIDVIGAIYSLICIGKSPADWMPVLLPIALGFSSYFLYHRRLKLKQM